MTLEGDPEILTPIYEYDDISDGSAFDFSLAPFMAETCHPNRAGHSIIAKGLYDTFLRLLQEKSP